MMQVPLSNGLISFVDAGDFATVQGFRWHALKRPNNRGWYVWRRGKRGEVRTVYMHRQITSAPMGMEVDHWDHNGLNNTRANLRIATRHQNLGNGRFRRGVSGFRGVHKGIKGRWVARISKGNRASHIGSFSTREEAARAYDTAAIAHFGREFATLNFPELTHN